MIEALLIAAVFVMFLVINAWFACPPDEEIETTPDHGLMRKAPTSRKEEDV